MSHSIKISPALRRTKASSELYPSQRVRASEDSYEEDRLSLENPLPRKKKIDLYKFAQDAKGLNLKKFRFSGYIEGSAGTLHIKFRSSLSWTPFSSLQYDLELLHKFLKSKGLVNLPSMKVRIVGHPSVDDLIITIDDFFNDFSSEYPQDYRYTAPRH